MATYCVVRDGDPEYSEERFKTREEALHRLNEVEAVGHRARLVRWENNQPTLVSVDPAIKSASPTATVFITRLLGRGFRWTHDTRKLVELTHPASGEVVYLMLGNKTGKSVLRVHPQREDLARVIIEEVRFEGVTHNSNMRAFPEHVNEGEKPTHYGLAFTVDSTTGLDHLLDHVLRNA